MSEENTSVQGKVTDILAGLGAKEINFHFPCNTANMLVVSYKYQKDQRSFVMSKIEIKLSEEPLYKIVQTRFDLSLSSRYNACQPSSLEKQPCPEPKSTTS